MIESNTMLSIFLFVVIWMVPRLFESIEIIQDSKASISCREVGSSEGGGRNKYYPSSPRVHSAQHDRDVNEEGS